MNKTILAPLFTMLVVSCGTTLPSFESSTSSLLSSQHESSLISQITSSSSIISSSSSTSTSTTSSIQSTSSSSSSTSTSSSTSSTTSEPPLNTRKVPFNQIGSLVAQVVDAKAIGIINNKDRPQVSGRKSAQEEDQNYIVKVTETYNPNTEITEDQTVQVTFSRVTNTQTTELQTGTESYVATTEALEIERLTDLAGNIVITNVEGYEFRLMSGEVVVQDWLSSEQETLEFIFDEALTGVTLESRSLNASVSFIAFEGFTYTIKQGETVIYEDLQDNDEADNNEALGNITLSGLIEGLTYDVTYEGYQVIETITQDEVEGQVDKLYVLYQYTFISFVPLNLNSRPQDQDLELDYDDVPLYDKQGYFSESTRQSFVVDNDTGLIYKIENINITSLSGGCVSVQDSPFPFDMRITQLGNLEFFTLHQNASITTYSCIKDKFGNKFVRNNRINTYSVENKTTFFVYDVTGPISSWDPPFAREISYWLTSAGKIIKFPHPDWSITPLNDLSRTEVSEGLNYFRPINELDNFSIFHISTNGFNERTFKVENGFSYSYQATRWIFNRGFTNSFYAGKFSIVSNTSYTFVRESNLYDYQFLEKYNILLEFNSNRQVVAYNNFFNQQESLDSFSSNSELILEEVDFENGLFVRYDLQGKETYELHPQIDELGNLKIKAFITGTYVAPPTTSVTLQPINK